MIQGTYKELIERIARLSSQSVGEIERRIEAKRAKLSGLISEEGAAQVVAAELGISFEKQHFKIADLLIGMKKIKVTGKILEIYPVRKYQKAEREGEIGSFLLADEFSNIRVVLWDTKHIEMIKNNKIKKDSVIEIKNADVRGMNARELHLSSGAEIQISDKEINAVKIAEVLPVKKIIDLKAGERAGIRASIVQIFQPNFFFTCPECSIKVTYEGDKAVCRKHGVVIPKKRSLLSLVLDDGSNSIRAIIFNENIFKLFNIPENEIEKLQEPSFLDKKKQELLGTESLFLGRARKNMLFDRVEWVIDEIREINPDELIRELSKG